MRRRTLVAMAAAAVALLAHVGTARAQFKLEWHVDGYYRTRAVSVTNLAHEPRYQVNHPALGVPVVMPDIKRTSYITQRLRLDPRLEYENIAKLYVQIDAFDDVLWGDNNAINSAPLFSVNGSNQGFLGGAEKPSIEAKRAWIEFAVPIGLMRVGRMPSHWGMGLLANGGGSGNRDPMTPIDEPKRKVPDYYFDDDFGDNHFGSTNDRILFATRPLTILKTIQKKPDTSSNLVVAYAFDKISEAPLLANEPTRLVRPFGQQGFISRGAKQDDVNEHVFVLAYANPDWDRVRYSDELKLGTYWVIRTQDEGFTEPSAGPPHTPEQCMALPNPEECVTHDEGSFVWIADFWYRVRYGPWYSEAEFVHIGGESTGGVPFPGANRRKKASIDGAAFRFGYMTEQWDAIVEAGYSSGDEDLTDMHFKQRALHPDHNVGLILYEEIIRERGARAFGPPFFSQANPEGARGLFPNGGVINSMYLFPKFRYRPGFGGFEFVGAVLMAWLDEWAIAPPNIFVCPPDATTDDGNGNLSCSMSKYLGTEFDFALKSRFAGDHIDFSLETGYLVFGDPLKITTTGRRNPTPADGSFTIQARVAMVF